MFPTSTEGKISLEFLLAGGPQLWQDWPQRGVRTQTGSLVAVRAPRDHGRSSIPIRKTHSFQGE